MIERVQNSWSRGPTLTRMDLLVAVWMVATMGAFLHNFLFVHSPDLSFGYAFVSYGTGLLLARTDQTIRHLLGIGTIAGFVELLGDRFLVQVVGTLTYPAGSPSLASSPAYMPFAWAVLVTFMGYVGVRLVTTFGTGVASVGPAVLAFVAESGFESLAGLGGGWTYAIAPVGWIGHAPIFIVVAEALMFSTVYFWSNRGVLVGGLGMGVTINVAYVLTYHAFVLLTTV